MQQVQPPGPASPLPDPLHIRSAGGTETEGVECLVPGTLWVKQALLLGEAAEVRRGASRPSVLPGQCSLPEVRMAKVALTGSREACMHLGAVVWMPWTFENLPVLQS